MKNRIFRAIKLSLIILGVLSLAQCGDDDPLAPFEPEINSSEDSFQLQATGVTKLTTILTYDWVNTGVGAIVDHSTTTSSGSARLVIKDSAGKVVYDHQLVPSLNQTTDGGKAGGWKIQLMLQDYTGTLNFRVQKLT